MYVAFINTRCWKTTLLDLWSSVLWIPKAVEFFWILFPPPSAMAVFDLINDGRVNDFGKVWFCVFHKALEKGQNSTLLTYIPVRHRCCPVSKRLARRKTQKFNLVFKLWINWHKYCVWFWLWFRGGAYESCQERSTDPDKTTTTTKATKLEIFQFSHWKLLGIFRKTKEACHSGDSAVKRKNRAAAVASAEIDTFPIRDARW